MLLFSSITVTSWIYLRTCASEGIQQPLLVSRRKLIWICYSSETRKKIIICTQINRSNSLSYFLVQLLLLLLQDDVFQEFAVWTTNLMQSTGSDPLCWRRATKRSKKSPPVQSLVGSANIFHGGSVWDIILPIIIAAKHHSRHELHHMIVVESAFMSIFMAV